MLTPERPDLRTLSSRCLNEVPFKYRATGLDKKTLTVQHAKRSTGPYPFEISSGSCCASDPIVHQPHSSAHAHTYVPISHTQGYGSDTDGRGELLTVNAIGCPNHNDVPPTVQPVHHSQQGRHDTAVVLVHPTGSHGRESVDFVEENDRRAHAKGLVE